MATRSVKHIDQELQKLRDSRRRAEEALDAVLRAPEVDSSEVTRYQSWIADCEIKVDALLDERNFAARW